jgi:NAD(P)-dependent dehydrogenase (short-subunit alcohol dehydrogenase family)
MSFAASFDGKMVLITGAAGSLGRATAAAFAKAGAHVALLDRDAAPLAAAFGVEDEKRLFLVADLGSQDAVMAAAEKAGARFGRIDVLCNIAGGFHMGEPVHETTDEVWRQMLELNAGSLVRMGRAVVPGMIARKSGKIVSVAAMGGLTGGARMSAYAASKSAVIRITESMALELRDHGINVNCVLPSTIDTAPNRASMPKADFSRWVAPDALADVILFLASDAARAVNGAALPVVGRV